MPQRILALDVEETEVKAAVLETSFRDYRIAGLYHEALTPDGGATGEQVRRFLDRHQLAGETVVSTLPGGLVSHRVFFLPFRDRKRLNQTIPFELETQVPFGLDEVIVDYSVLHRDRSGTTVLAAMVQKSDLEAHLAMLRSAGIDPKVVDLASLSGLNVLRVLSADLPATFAFVECNANSVHVALYRNQQLVGLRTLTVRHGAPSTNGASNGHAVSEPVASMNGQHDDSAARALAVELRWSLMVINGAPLDDRLPCYVAGSPAWLDHSAPVLERELGFELRRLDRIPLRMMTPADQAALPTCTASLGVALREVAPANTLGLNFRRDEFAYHRGQQEVRRAFGRVAILVGVLLVMTIADLFAAYQFQLSRLTAIDGQIRKVFMATLPDERPVNEIAQFKGEVDKAEQKLQLLGGIVSLSGAAAIDIARAISAALTDKAKLDIDEYTYDPEAVRIRGRTDSFETVDTIKQQLVGVPYFKDVQVKDVKASADGKDVSFRLILIMTKDTHLGE